MKKDLIIKELARRSKIEDERAKRPKFTVEEFCFDKQIQFINDKSKFKTAVCSRRAGKSVACVSDLINTALTQEGDVAYVTLNRRTAKKIIWRELLRINQKYELGGKADNTELTMSMPNGNVIYLTGAKDESEIEKLLGVGLRKIYIDECQSFRPYIQRLVEEILEPTLTDYDGSLILIGTPGPVPAGYFYESTMSKGWSHHAWTLHDNPHIELKSGKKVDQLIRERCERRGITSDHPSIQREYFGKWVKDTDSLVYHFSAQLNEFEKMPEAKKSDVNYIFGVDIGWSDSDAIAILAYNYVDKNVYLVEEFIKDKQTISDLVKEITTLREKYKPVKIVMDAGALGKKIQEEIRQRHGIFMEAAEKHRKFEFIELMNDDLRTGRLKAYKGSRFAEDCLLVQWDRSTIGKLKISDSYHTDIGDAVLYAWRECKHYLAEHPAEATKPGTDKYMAELEAREAEEMDLRKKKSIVDDIVGSQEDMDSLSDDVNDAYIDE